RMGSLSTRAKSSILPNDRIVSLLQPRFEMSMFRKEARPKGTRDRGPASARIAMADGSFSMVAAGMVVTGDIVTEGIVRIEGEVHGTIRAAKTVILGQSGRI